MLLSVPVTPFWTAVRAVMQRTAMRAMIRPYSTSV
jgi:hypothetical protein